jgi:hypothetical protein
VSGIPTQPRTGRPLRRYDCPDIVIAAERFDVAMTRAREIANATGGGQHDPAVKTAIATAIIQSADQQEQNRALNRIARALEVQAEEMERAAERATS